MGSVEAVNVAPANGSAAILSRARSLALDPGVDMDDQPYPVTYTQIWLR
jgi:hypothetical protein